MMQIFRSNRTSDDELASAIKQAASTYNGAVRAAIRAGLTVSAVASYDNSSREYIGSRTIEVDVLRNTSTRL